MLKSNTVFKKNESPDYVFKAILSLNRSSLNRSTSVRRASCILSLKPKHIFFKNCFSQAAIAESNKLDLAILNSESFSLF